MKHSLLIPKSRLVVSVAAVAWGLLTPGPLLAVEDFWDAAANGTWTAGMNWLDGSPPDTSSHEATFALPGTYTVSFPSDPPPIGLLTLEAAANITFASAARPPNPIQPHTLQIVDDLSGGGRVNLSNGASLTLGATSGGSNFPFHLAAESLIQLSGGSTLTARFGSHVHASVISAGVSGQSGQGAMSLLSGAVASSINGTIGIGGTTGSVIVSGIGSQWNIAGSMQIGDAFGMSTPGGNGTLTVSGGGFVQNTQANLSKFGQSTSTVTVTGDGSLWKSSALEVGSGGTIQIQPGGTVRVDGETFLSGSTASLRLQGGTLDTGALRGDTHFDWTGGTLHVGTFDGFLNQLTGTLAPGHSAGVTNVTNGYVLGNAARLEIEIGGAAQGTEHDVVNTANGLFVGGQLDVNLINAFMPTPSQTFIIMNSQNGPVGGAFVNAATGGRVTTVGGGGSFQVHYGTGSAFDPRFVVLNNFQPDGITGDFDVDGDVDGEDFLIWQRGGSPHPLTPADLAEWRGNFGFRTLTVAGNAIPEPAASGLLVTAVTLTSASRCRRKLAA